ncbi:sensor histidine kinase [Lacihabitans lacunae]|uniref:histidine kinase n=1 Tax=Lacihabitans lacunae TaxID=1028214 RepID=A0ABV7YTK9_9BACT
MAASSSIDLYLLLFSGTFTMLTLAVGVITFSLHYQKRIIKKDLALKEAEVKFSEELFLGNLNATENERNRLARDLHDVVGASLSAIKLQMNEIGRDTNNQEKIKELISKNKQTIDNTILEVRRISNDLLPPGLEEFGIAYAIEGLCESVVDITDINITLNIKLKEKLSNQKSLTMYRIVQELLNNSVKHSAATQISIDFIQNDTEFLFKFEDNGIGFDFDEAYQKRSLGLKNIQVRAKMIHGETEFQTSDNEGLKVFIKLPLN